MDGVDSMYSLIMLFDGTRMRQIELIFADVEYSYSVVIQLIHGIRVPSKVSFKPNIRIFEA